MTLRRKLAWVSVLYFAEGFPFGVVVDTLPVYFRVHGVSLTDIGLMSLLGMPWTLKVFWSPLVDRFGTYQRWIVSCLVLVAMALAAGPWFDPTQPTMLLWAVLLVLTVAAATQDIGIDAYTINLVKEGEEGAANGVRVSAYRAALIVAGGGLLLLPGRFGWTSAYLVACGIAIALSALVAASPEVQRPSPLQQTAAWGRWSSRSGSIAACLWKRSPSCRPLWACWLRCLVRCWVER
jgi:PAT family beta-lactamase induction signal transducer AmpG